MLQVDDSILVLKERLAHVEASIKRCSEVNIRLTMMNASQARELTHLNKACARKERRLKELRAIEQLYKEYVKLYSPQSAR